MAHGFPKLGVAALVAAIALALAGCSEQGNVGPVQGGGSGGIGGSGGTGGGGGTGGSGADGGTGGGLEVPAGCVALDLGPSLTMQHGLAAFGLEAKASPGLSGAALTHAAFELHEWNRETSEPMPVELGTFDLTEPPNDGYGTCQQCTLLIAYGPDGFPQRFFFQKSGEAQITKLGEGDEARSVAAGTLRDVQLREIVQQPDFTWADVPDSDCYWIAEWSFDTTPNNGAPCERAEDCANTALQSCDPQTGRCVSHQCSFTGDITCPEGQICVNQVPTDPTWGACYPMCTPFIAGQCQNDEICVPFGPTQSLGACKKVGTGRLGESCDEPDLSTGCEWGAVCQGDPPVCTKMCRYLSQDPGCPEGQVCGIDNICKDPSTGDPAQPGEECDPSSPWEAACGADGEAFAGVCLSLFPDIPELTCYELCRTSDHDPCGEGAYCATLFSNPEFGLCWPEAVCGDGALDPLTEVCDDGGTIDGDGCRGDCLAAEFDVLCEEAPALTLDETITGTTEGGPAGYVGSCRLYQVVPAATYRFTPPGPGTLSLSLASSEANLDIVVLGDCADPMSELGCAGLGLATERLDVDFAAANGTEALVVVTGSGLRDEGTFELQAHFTAAVCGDGKVAGPELCDDGNTDGGDGCSADCLALEWPQLCAALPVLSTGSLNEGNTSASSDFQEGSLVCAFAGGDGNEQMYTFTAPHAGELTLRLLAEADHVLYVIEGCQPLITGEEMLSCSNSGFPGEYEVSQVQLVAGQQITVVVEGFRPMDAGPFSLEATFQ